MTTYKDNILQPTTLHEAVNLIKFLKTSHKQDIDKLKDVYMKQAEKLKKLEASRKTELDYLSGELQKYELNLALKTEMVRKQLLEKDEIIARQQIIIEELSKKLKATNQVVTPQVTVQVESNSDSGIALDNDETSVTITRDETETKTIRKCSRRFADPISFFRRVDFSPMKYKPSFREKNKEKNDKKKNTLEVPSPKAKVINYHKNSDKVTSEDDRTFEDAIFSDGYITPVIIKPKQMNDSMNNHFSDDGSEDTSEELFDRVMTRNSIRRSVKANPKYKKINRSKSKLLGKVKVNIMD